MEKFWKKNIKNNPLLHAEIICLQKGYRKLKRWNLKGTNINRTSIHLMIIWSEAQIYKNKILEDLNKNFKIHKIFSIRWDQNLFLENYTVFYAHSLKKLDRTSLKKVLNEKILHCGKEKFTVIIFHDNLPHYSSRQTSDGERIVNTNVFDKKQQYREWTGGGHRIHASDDEWETNKDLTLLIGQNIEDFLIHTPICNISEEELHTNCIGVNGYQSIKELFYVLNNTTKYVILRNFDCLPEKYTIEGHGDIDLLVENKNYISYLTLAKPVFNEPYRVYHYINIKNENIPFDFRYLGDNYYDIFWEEQILNNRQLRKNLFYTPNDEDLFYSLLYHVYIQKWSVKQDYIPKLQELARKINKQFIPSSMHAIQSLDIFMKKRNYEYIKPNDISVAYNETNIRLSTHALRHGKNIKTLKIKEDSGLYSKVFEKKNSFIKIGANKIIDNEATYLNRLSKYKYFPKILKWEKGESESILEITQGLFKLKTMRFSPDIKALISTMIISFGGLCIHMQVSSILADTKIKYKNYLISRIFQTILAPIILIILLFIYRI